MRNVQLLLFLVTLPAIAAIGHDLYLYYENPNDPFKFAALGFIWTRYHPDSYRQVVEMLDPEIWSKLNYILTFRAFFAGLGFAAIFYIITGVVILLKKTASGAALAREKGISTLQRDGQMKYNYKKRGGR